MDNWTFKVGDTVTFMNETGTGIILNKLDGNRYYIQDEDGFEEVYHLKDLVIPFSQMKAAVKPEVPVENFETELAEELVSWNGISENDVVRPLDDEGEGVVINISKEGVFSVELNIGLMIDYKREELVKVGAEQDKSLLDSVEFVGDVLKSEDFVKKIKAKKTDRKNEGTWEVDLHVHEITEETDFLGPAELLKIQMDYFELKLKEAIKRKVKKVIFIHGRGKGKLKNEIRAILKRYPHCEFHDGNYHRYGQGATEVWIYNSMI